MASAKSGSTTRRTSASRGSAPKREQEVSPARWAGVAFVITAIMAAIFLAMFSPSSSGTPVTGTAPEASAEPSPTVLDVQPPSAKPTITSPSGGVTTEFDIAVTVELPKEDLPKETLRLYVMRGEEVLKEKASPKNPGSVTVKGVQIDEGENELTAVLSGPGGFGPRSEPILMIVDKDAPDLEILLPEDKTETYEKTVQVEGISEVESEVLVVNETNKSRQPYGTVGTSGEFAVSVALKPGATNKIRVESTDAAGVDKKRWVKVIQLDGRPRVKIRDIDPIDRSALPAKVKIVVDVKDAKGKPMPGAEAYFSLGAPDRLSETETIVTNTNGRAVWTPTVSSSSSSADALELSVTVTSALSDDEKKVAKAIPFK